MLSLEILCCFLAVLEMRVSHIPKEDVPPMELGQWDCEGEHYSILAPHIECDLIIHCVSARDEQNCSHTTHQCKGGVQIGTRK